MSIMSSPRSDETPRSSPRSEKANKIPPSRRGEGQMVGLSQEFTGQSMSSGMSSFGIVMNETTGTSVASSRRSGEAYTAYTKNRGKTSYDRSPGPNPSDMTDRSSCASRERTPTFPSTGDFSVSGTRSRGPIANKIQGIPSPASNPPTPRPIHPDGYGIWANNPYDTARGSAAQDWHEEALQGGLRNGTGDELTKAVHRGVMDAFQGDVFRRVLRTELRNALLGESTVPGTCATIREPSPGSLDSDRRRPPMAMGAGAGMTADGFNVVEASQEKPDTVSQDFEDEDIDPVDMSSMASHQHTFIHSSSSRLASSRTASSGNQASSLQGRSMTPVPTQGPPGPQDQMAEQVIQSDRLAKGASATSVGGEAQRTLMESDFFNQHPRVADAVRRAMEFIEWYQALEEPPRRSTLARIVLSPGFQIGCGLIILINSLTSAWVVNYQMSLAQGGSAEANMAWVDSSEWFFFCFYFGELLVKLVVHRWYYFVNDDAHWNIFDLILIVIAFQDQMMSIMGENPGLDAKFMRVLRLMKLGKAVRVFRLMRFFSELRLFLDALVGSVPSLFWTVVMMIMMLYIFGLVFVQGAVQALRDGGELTSDQETRLLRNFGSVQEAMFTLFKASTGGEDWAVYTEDLRLVGMFYSVTYLAFITFNNIAFMNILTALFVENASKLAQPDRDQIVLQQRENLKREQRTLKRLCHEVDRNGSGFIDPEEFAEQMEQKKGHLRAYLEVAGVDCRDAKIFFQMLELHSGDGRVDIEAFVHGVLKIKGDATSLDMQVMSCQISIMYQHLAKKLEEVGWFAKHGPRPGRKGADTTQNVRFAPPASGRGTNNRRLVKDRAEPEDEALIVERDPGRDDLVL